MPGTGLALAYPGMSDQLGRHSDQDDVLRLGEPLLTTDDVAILLAVPRSSVYEYARRAHRPLPSMLVGRHRRFYRCDVELWLDRMR
jgi:excisionase family DNA binding protein